MDFLTAKQKRHRSTRRTTSSSRRKSSAGRVMNMTSPSGPQLRALQNMLSRGPLTLILVYSPSCPHCHTYMPLWKDLCKTQGRRANLVSMKSDIYDKTPLSAKKTITSVPSVIYVDNQGQVAEVEDIRNEPLMKNVVKTASASSEPATDDIFMVEESPSPMKPLLPPIEPPSTPIAGSTFRESPLPPLPALPVQQGGNPWAAFLMSAARQAAPAAALMGAYAALPKRSSGLPAARRSRRRKTRRRSRE